MIDIVIISFLLFLSCISPQEIKDRKNSIRQIIKLFNNSKQNSFDEDQEVSEASEVAQASEVDFLVVQVMLKQVLSHLMLED